jgi:hypothetical protein
LVGIGLFMLEFSVFNIFVIHQHCFVTNEKLLFHSVYLALQGGKSGSRNLKRYSPHLSRVCSLSGSRAQEYNPQSRNDLKLRGSSVPRSRKVLLSALAGEISRGNCGDCILDLSMIKVTYLDPSLKTRFGSHEF